ncbi:MAG: radical SAM protein [Armatimonadetes bacterium]|nr:radical SAM protein [Armatimonadota bacterium]
MSILESGARWIVERIGLRTVALEVTQRCNQHCAFCYNVWKRGGYPEGQLDTCATKDIIDRIMRSYRPYVISFTGGEPMLRPDIFDLIRHASRRVKCNLITNGTLIDDTVARELVGAGVSVFEFTLLAADPETHNSLVGRDSFVELIDAIASVMAAGGTVTTTFVATRRNIRAWPETLELNVALGASGILFNRFNIGGEGVEYARELAPSLKEIETALEAANDGAARYGIDISCGVPIPQCIIDRRRYPTVHFSDCALGTRHAYPAVDPMGNLRPCNHSPLILGKVLESDMSTLLRSGSAKGYCADLPVDCVGCADARTCRGGCRAASDACGDPGSIDPFVTVCKGGGEKCATCG